MSCTSSSTQCQKQDWSQHKGKCVSKEVRDYILKTAVEENELYIASEEFRRRELKLRQFEDRIREKQADFERQQVKNTTF